MSADTMLGRLAATVFGGGCYVCRAATQRGALLCVECEAELPRLPAAHCPRCALPGAAGSICGRCIARPGAFDATIAAFTFAFPADVMVRALKFGSELALAPYLGAQLAGCLGATVRADLIIPVPLHPRRLAERGYNQSVEIARTLARRTGRPLVVDGCMRTRDTPAQAELPMDERHRNLRGAFSCSLELAGRHVALVDDVMTTGATLDALAAAVKLAGAASVENWVVARTL